MIFRSEIRTSRSVTASRLALLLLTSMGYASAQLHLITGSPTASSDVNSYPSTLLRVNNDHRVTQLEQLSESSVLIDVSYDHKLAAIVADEGYAKVIPFLESKVTKECQLHGIQGSVTLSYWLADDPGKALLLDWYMNDLRTKHAAVRGMVLAPSVPCDESTIELAPSDIRYVVMHGDAGVADLVSPFIPFRAYVDERKQTVQVSAAGWTPLDLPPPHGLFKGFEQADIVATVSDSHVLALTAANRDMPYHRVLVCRKSDKSWRILPVGGDRPQVRGFGKYIAVTEGVVKNARNSESAGKAEWNEKMRLTFQNYTAAYPGRLYLYDIETEKVRKIETNQGDSEILLVDGSTVYYRISDRIYSAPITDDGIGSPQLVAQAEEIRDAHWAFMRH